jgi:geranylgeranyl diphosphate synthase type I
VKPLHSWETTLDEYGLLVENKLSSFLGSEIKNGVKYHSLIGEVHKDLHGYMFRGGKRLASCSVILTYKGFTNRIDDRILDFSVGLELYRHAILVHDDLVDNDEMRRGLQTIHKIYSEDYDLRFGSGLAVFAGNMLFALAQKAFCASGFEPEKIVRTLKMVGDGYQAVNESQILDLLFEYKIPEVSEWYVMASKRAASLFKVALSAGAILANASEKDVELLNEVGSHIGYSFDIQDDIIDLFASEEQYGRKPGGDLSKQKKPLHIVYMYKMANREQLDAFETAVKGTTLEHLTVARRVVSDCGALEAAKKRSKEHAENAKKLLSQTAMNSDTKDFFTSFIDYVESSLDWYGLSTKS